MDLEPVAIVFFFVLEHGWLEEVVGVGVAERQERGLVLAHEVHDGALVVRSGHGEVLHGLGEGGGQKADNRDHER